MIHRYPAYYPSFSCLGGACPDTCCKDWEIVLDETTLVDYRQAPLPLRSLILNNLAQDSDGDTYFQLRPDGHCALLTPDGLCPIQRDWGEEHLCEHCGAYPRFIEEYGSLTEASLAISCPRAAQLLMEVPHFLLTSEDDGQATSPFRSLWDKLAQMDAYAHELQKEIDQERYMDPGLPHTTPPLAPSQALLIPLLQLYEQLEPLRQDWPQRLEQCKRLLGFMPQADYQEACRGFEAAYPQWELHLTNLACYLVFRHWHKTVNDDLLYGRAAATVSACLLLYHLALAVWLEHGDFSSQEELPLWCAFSREVEHMEENWTQIIDSLDQTPLWRHAEV